MTRPQTERCRAEQREQEISLIGADRHGSLQTIREARVERFVPRRREPVLCSAMGKNLAGTLMSGERQGEEMGPNVLSC